MVKNKTIKTFEILNIFSSVFMIILLLWVLVGSLNYWNVSMQYARINGVSTNSILFSLSVLIAIVTVISQWIYGRTKSIIKSSKNLKGGISNERRKRKRS